MGADAGSAEALADFGLRVATSAYDACDVDAMREVHATLFALYELNVADLGTGQACNQFDPVLIASRDRGLTPSATSVDRLRIESRHGA
ncbi:hypothetical protein [Burkholderia cepacia]|uniref:hypothetical protein n=1 Tax=Burkholderia cepacia TaxID=292 RepID=UPI0005A1867F|nr:hypothetical protein [Burkholderia cepacia]